MPPPTDSLGKAPSGEKVEPRLKECRLSERAGEDITEQRILPGVCLACLGRRRGLGGRLVGRRLRRR